LSRSWRATVSARDLEQALLLLQRQLVGLVAVALAGDLASEARDLGLRLADARQEVALVESQQHLPFATRSPSRTATSVTQADAEAAARSMSGVSTSVELQVPGPAGAAGRLRLDAPNALLDLWLRLLRLGGLEHAPRAG
jgi:hypothetical protein